MNTKPLLANYSPKLVEALKKAATSGISIPCPDRKTAVALRHRLNSLRRVMKEEAHPDADLVQRITFILAHTPTNILHPFTIVGKPSDFQFEDLLDAAGVHLPDAPDLED